MTAKHADSDSFVAEFPLRTTPADERALHVRLDAARNIYNAALGEALRRLDLMRESRAWQAARAMPKGKERGDAFRAVSKRFEFSAFALIKFTQDCRNACWIKDHLGSQECQALTKRAFGVVEQYQYGKRGRAKVPRQGVFQLNRKSVQRARLALRWRPDLAS